MITLNDSIEYIQIYLQINQSKNSKFFINVSTLISKAQFMVDCLIKYRLEKNMFKIKQSIKKRALLISTGTLIIVMNFTWYTTINIDFCGIF